MQINIVVTTYNRKDKVVFSIQSALTAVKQWGNQGKVILVDDASTDGTLDYLEKIFLKEIMSGLLVLVAHLKNMGVTGAKNTGYFAVDTGWVGFLDSDDSLIASEYTALKNALLENCETPIVFFRCKDQNHNKIGVEFYDVKKLDLITYIKYTSYGEALTFINRSKVSGLPYLDVLRGYEGFGCARIIKKYGPGLLIPLYVRQYNCEGDDRLSGVKALIKRSGDMSKGHVLFLRGFYSEMSLSITALFIIKIIVYKTIFLGCALYRHVVKPIPSLR